MPGKKRRNFAKGMEVMPSTNMLSGRVLHKAMMRSEEAAAKKGKIGHRRVPNIRSTVRPDDLRAHNLEEQKTARQERKRLRAKDKPGILERLLRVFQNIGRKPRK